ncbi:thiamine pyrophosphate-requiring protein [Mangrovibrevibacter kandeliae]|uniref:thiamine pyrophosphate-requiring protein n=1 Tax=Mangrovibrevibacter kandeliae TaxID=2968473 RepID=UPI002118A6FF|nr:thiamine pyrophosphate-requiring protein [Aurantimonas sp. CSK15Z-1]MCQ8782686.1 thiamine pyrophosphate-requiring protein [Aurantimonas sp. CSK15Z-1]
MRQTTSSEMTAGAVLLGRLKTVGVDYIFANSGTDFPPIIEGLAEAMAKDVPLPQAVVIPHENAAMGMAHGYFLATGRAQCVMAHTNVGLANCAIGAINAATEHVPVLLMSGRTPVLESGRLGARTVPIGWGQEMRDQAALVREATKWDYELKFAEQAAEVVDRAHAVANSTPKGPVYVSLPREVLCGTCAAPDPDAGGSSIAPAHTAPHPQAVAEAAALLAKAESPLIIVQRGAGTTEAFGALADLADRWGIAVSQYWAIQLGVATDHPMAAGSDPGQLLAEADVIAVIDCLAPWSPEIHALKPGAKVIHLGPDPLYARFPVRNFRVDLALTGETGDAMLALAAALDAHALPDRAPERRERIAAANAATRDKVRAAALAGRDGLMTKAYVSHCLSEAIADHDATVLSELGCPLDPLELRTPGSWFQEPHSGGLGWAFPAGLGMQLANRDRLIVATMGDGSYMFANPVACHQIAEALGLPLLVLVLNNREWGAVRQSVLGVYPDGYAAKANTMPLTSLEPTPDFTKVAEASRAWTARVDEGDALPGVLTEAIRQVRENKRHALVEIRIRP